MPRKSRLAFLAGLAALAFLILAGGWLWAKTVVVQGWDTWVEERRAEGYRFSNAEPEVSGFPFRVVATLDSPVIEAPQGWRWDAPPIRAEAGLWDPFTIHFGAPGTHRFVLPDGEEIEARTENADGHLALAPAGGLDAAALTLRDVALSRVPLAPGLSLTETTARTLELEAGPQSVSDAGVARVAFAAVLRGLTLPQQLDLPFAREIATLGIEGALLGPLPERASEVELRRWRQDGGAVEIDSVRIHWPPLRLDGGGKLSLDEALRPSGELEVEARGLEKALKELSEAGLLEDNAATYARLAVAALGERDSRTGENTVRAPITLREGRFYLGPVPLFELSPVLADRTSPLGALR